MQKLEIQLNGGEGILNFMCKAAGERAQLGQTLGLARASFQNDEPAVGIDADQPRHEQTARPADYQSPSEPSHGEEGYREKDEGRRMRMKGQN